MIIVPFNIFILIKLKKKIAFALIIILSNFTKKKIMASFDIQSKADLQTLDNAINITEKEISNRFDFKGQHVVFDFDKKTYVLKVEAESEMKIDQIVDVLISRGMRQGLDGNVFDTSKAGAISGKVFKKEIPLRNGIDMKDAKKIVALIKEKKIKVEAAIMNDIIRVTGKKIDDLQEVIALCKEADLGIPLQFVNMKS
jgi:cyclic-di-GMP-binding protein